MSVVGVIPARLESSRLPRKLLLAETGWPLIEHTWRAASAAESLDELIVATDSEEIAETVRGFGGRAELTGEHPSGTDRVAEVVERFLGDAELIVNVQGDEPELDPAVIDRLVAVIKANPNCPMATVATPIHDREMLADPSCVKVVVTADGRALYFSRSMIPACRDERPEAVLAGESPWLLHLGIYAYRREFLLELTRRPPSRLERLERLEQLRALEAGVEIRLAIVEGQSVGIDTPGDYARFVARVGLRAA